MDLKTQFVQRNRLPRLLLYRSGVIVEIVFVDGFFQSQRGKCSAAKVAKRWNWSDGKTFADRRIIKQANVTSKLTLLHGEPGPTIVEYANK